MALFDRLASRASDRAREMADEALERAERVFAQFPDVRLRRDGDTLVLEAMGLMRRWMNDIRLRFAMWAPSTSTAGPPPRAGEELQ